MADENEPNRPEEDPPGTRTPGENDGAQPESPNAPPSPTEASDALEDSAEQPAPEAAAQAATEPEPAAPLYAAETISEPESSAEAMEPPPASSTGALPPNYFRAAGDPDEPPPEEPPPTLLNQARAKANEYWTRLRAYAEPRWVKFSGAARAFTGEMWNRIRGIKRPKSVREAAVWGGWIAAGGVALIIAFFLFITWGLPSTDDLWEARQGQSITFVDRNGHVILREGAQNAPPVDLATLPPYVAQAFIAIEDRKFYNHLGVDFGGMMRAGAENIRAGRVVQGGSTITQQLAKNLFLTNERSWRRKAQEIMLAFWLESRFTKDEILALYLSRVYFGAGAYGIEAAAERYFDRPARELTLLQSAMIAGLVKAPSRLNPARQDIAAARERATVVLNEMVAMGFISAAERDAALQEELVISRRNPAGVLSYYRDWIDPLLNQVIGNERDDFIIETTIDIAAQRAAAEAVELVLAEQGEDRRVGQAAALALDDQGGVRVMVGGRDYDQSQFNRATQARRQPGSSFKYFIYLAAMENGLTPWSVRDDSPITISIPGQPDWTPGNYTEEFHGPVTLTSAYANSFNMVAIRVANEIGGDRVIDAARRLGVTSPLANYHSLALGAQEITLLEMVSAYGAMAADGNRVEAHGVTRIRRASSDEVMWSWRPANRGRVIEERPFRYMNQLMRRVVDAGTGTRARMTGREIGGKTGTGNDYRDAWFIGYTPGMVAGVWVGNDNFTTTARVTGGSLPADIWARFMPVALRNTPTRAMEMPTEEDYDLGTPAPQEPSLAVVGAPVGAVLGAPAEAPPDTEDRSLDFGPEG
ncbi:PBP1A family penicillin-binding protein [Vitreimonas sp.]|uniref:transglycosylase domain-containing protein n=1 Tax=Vitreimonas sp. TaxID=3069702 RepID=UPI002ED9B6CC